MDALVLCCLECFYEVIFLVQGFLDQIYPVYLHLMAHLVQDKARYQVHDEQIDSDIYYSQRIFH